MPTFEESSAILDAALSGGIVSFDTARGYGESELVLKRYFEQDSREHTIISKVVFADVDQSGVRDRLFTMVGESLERLGIERLPFLKLHNQTMLEQYGDTLVNAPRIDKAVAAEALKIAEQVPPIVIRPWEWA